MRQEPRLDADSGVGNGNLDLPVDTGEARIDSAAFIGELDRIGQQVPDCLLQSARVAENGTTRIIDHNREGNMFRLGAGPNDVDGGLEYSLDLDRMRIELEPASDDS